MTENPNNFDLTKYTYIECHLMGATVLHEHPFGDLTCTYLGTGLEKEYEPFYMKSNLWFLSITLFSHTYVHFMLTIYT
jgi:hypothetical protein